VVREVGTIYGSNDIYAPLLAKIILGGKGPTMELYLGQ
jgi:hypothetical protein